jgi:hypothetical protein
VSKWIVRLRWSDPEPDDPSTPLDWRFPALILSTLFLNFFFWYIPGPELWVSSSLLVYAGLVVAAALVAAVSFVGPALATHAAERPLLGVLENSLGSIPAIVLRLCCVLFVVLWIADLLWWGALCLLPFILCEAPCVPSAESAIIAAGILVFLFVTGLQSPRTSAKLALFTNKLGIAVLIAAFLRVHEGWPAIVKASSFSTVYSPAMRMWYGLSLMGFYVAPLGLLAANYGQRSGGRKQVVLTALMGVALPLAGTLLFVELICMATLHSFYTPSLTPNIAMALWNHAAPSAQRGPMMFAAMTTFGAVRFGARAIADSISIRPLGNRPKWVLLGFAITAIVWCSLHQEAPSLQAAFEISASCLAVAGAVITADFLTRRGRVEHVRRIDWIGLLALLAGSTAPMYIPGWIVGADPWWHPWLLPSYGVGFLVCLSGRTIQKMLSVYNRETTTR